MEKRKGWLKKVAIILGWGAIVVGVIVFVYGFRQHNLIIEKLGATTSAVGTIILLLAGTKEKSYRD